MTPLLAAAALATAAVTVGWPVPVGSARQRRLGLGGGGMGPAVTRAARDAVAHLRAAPPTLAVAAIAVSMVAAAAAAGPVAGLMATAYAGFAAWGLLGRRDARRREERRAQVLDDVAELAAELRAGRQVPVGPPAPANRMAAIDPVRARVAAAAVLAEETGAALADLLERIEADARAADRAAAALRAQTAGARTTASLLAGLPAAGLAVGYAIGADPLHVLLRTPLGAACAALAIVLQGAGLLWVGRITRVGGGA